MCRDTKSTQVSGDYMNETELNVCKILVGKREAKRPFGTLGCIRDYYQKLTSRNNISEQGSSDLLREGGEVLGQSTDYQRLKKTPAS
jgi:hypothetical protein